MTDATEEELGPDSDGVQHDQGAGTQSSSEEPTPDAIVEHTRAAFEEIGSIRPLASSAVLSQWASLMDQQLRPNVKSIQLVQEALAAAAPRFGLAQSEAMAAAIRTFANASAQATVNAATMEAIRVALGSYVPLSSRNAYFSGPPPKDSYSSDLSTTGDYFKDHEVVVESFEDLNRKIVGLISKAESMQLVWRGQQDADWGVHSSLFRRLIGVNGVRPPGGRVKGAQPYPTEDQVVAAEAVILEAARRDWRFDGMSALETFARIQHAGGHTRLIDVTKNPFIGAWFAVESNAAIEDRDARLFAFATTAPLSAHGDFPDAQIEMDAEWGAYLPPWHGWFDTPMRQGTDWGTGSRRRLWVPSAYDSRIAAQNAAFLLDGVPIPAGKLANYFPSPSGRWSRADMLAAGSIYLKTASPTRKQRPNKFNIAPVFTFRITADAKKEIRDILTTRFGYTTSYIYPDVAKLAEHVKVMALPSLDDGATASA